MVLVLAGCQGPGTGDGTGDSPPREITVNTFFINAGDPPATNSQSVVLQIDVSDADEMRFRNENTPDFSAAAWEPVTSAFSWTLSSGDGQKEVYAEFRNSDGSDTGVVATTTLRAIQDKNRERSP